MKEIGFKEVVEKEFNDGENPNLLLDLDSRKFETLYIECKSWK